MKRLTGLIAYALLLFAATWVYAGSELVWQTTKQEANVSIYEIYRSQPFKGRYNYNEVLTEASLSKDKTKILLVYQSGIKVVDAKSYNELYVRQDARYGAFSPDGKALALYTEGSRVKLVSTETWNELATINSYVYFSYNPFSNDGRKLALIHHEGAEIWDWATNKQLLKIGTNQEEQQHLLKFSPDDKMVLLISFGKQSSGVKYISMFDLQNHTRLWRFKLDNTLINNINFSPDGKKLLAADGADGSIKTWDAMSGYQLLNHKGFKGYVTSAEFSQDGKKIVAAASSSLHILDATTGKLDASADNIKQAYGQSSASFINASNIIFNSSPSIKIFGYSQPSFIYEYFSMIAPKQLYIKEAAYLESEKKIFAKGSYEFAMFDIYSDYLKVAAEKTKIKMSKYLSIPLIPKPTLPPMLTITKDEFETTKTFEDRVAKAKADRENTIAKLQDDYRKAVEDRNKELSGRLENKKTAELMFLKESLTEVLGKPRITDLAYDADKQTMYAKLAAEHPTFYKDIAIPIESEKARQLKADYLKCEVEAIFDVTSELVTLKDVKIKHNAELYAAILSEKEHRPQKVAVTLEDKKIDFSAMQNPNLIDKYQVQMIGYADAKNGSAQKYTDDLTPLVKNAKPSAKSPNKWLFAIAVENYAEADPVIFAKNSAEAFVAAAKKRFGIDDRHTYAYIDDKATGSGIKNNLERFLENIKDGDTIYFYYSGHGIPSPVDGEAFILPRDAIADYITKEQEFMARTIYKKLSESKAGKVFAFVDSCYSGKTDNIANIKGVAAGVFKTKKVEFDKNKMVVMTAGTSGQFSNAFNEKGHRLFTYHLTKAIIERPTLDMESLYQEVALKVKDESFKKGDIYRQEPQIEGNMKLELLK